MKTTNRPTQKNVQTGLISFFLNIERYNIMKAPDI